MKPGVLYQTGGIRYLIGEPDGGVTSRVQELIGEFRRSGLAAQSDTFIRRSLWRKVAHNAALNPVSVLTQCTTHRMLNDAEVRTLLFRLVDKAITVAKATGVDPEIAPEELLVPLADVRTSMLQDFQLRKELELEPIVGAVIELARLHGINVPALQTVYALTRLLAAALPLQ